ncbi:DEAD-box ATP-dependent RNA helicase 39 isoform X1 [Dendrobium catenatum]|uniref:DEAD-box ATP-dependent RNA helicase 39 n=1 Tax=Dendrobium catenatum TaxID=906689 RepID=A0A2I0WAL7_9ASPA|nr:DEAD-box ATP-dependent RNA helicase 39 isoform X1 [Dendrobium catenatum]PKU72696.1 DEAD-box ATP-dependent RNA helicase 39 [Dendrobium catenatum]
MAAIAGGNATGKVILSLYSSSSSSSSSSLFSLSRSTIRRPPSHSSAFLGFSPTVCMSTVSITPATDEAIPSLHHSLLLERLRVRHLKESSKGSLQNQTKPVSVSVRPLDVGRKNKEVKGSVMDSNFENLGLKDEVLGAVREIGISVPTEIQAIGVPAVLQGKNVVLASHTGSGKTLAYLLPLVQLLRHDEDLSGILMKPRRPRAVVLCPTRELTEQVFRVAKSISHHARFRSTMISGGGRSKPQEDSLNVPLDVVVGTPGRILQHIEDGNIVYGDIKYLVLDEADTMFDKGFGPDIRKFLGPLKKRAGKPGDQGFQTVLVTATMTKAVQKLIEEEFEGIVHLRTSTLHKKVASARHDFIKLSGTENKLESLLQVLEPSLARGNRVMVFCNTQSSSRAVDHFLTENQIYTVNYHGEVPSGERVENLRKFKSNEGDCPTLVCTDLAARGLDLDVDHVIMFDFPKNSIDYLHRTGRTARMGAKGKVTSLVAKKNLLLADRIEEAMRKNESLESLNEGSIRRDAVKLRLVDKKGRNTTQTIKTSHPKSAVIWRKAAPTVSQKSAPKSPVFGRAAAVTVSQKSAARKSGGKPASIKVKRLTSPSNPDRKPASIKAKKSFSLSKPASSADVSKVSVNKKISVKSAGSKLSIVGFRGRSSIGKK